MEIELLVYYFLFLSISIGLSAFLNGYLNTIFNLNKMYDPVVERSSHKDKATRSGGLALFLTFCICYGIGKALGVISVNLYALIAFCFVALIGVADDLFSIKYREKFFVQIFAGIVLLQSNVYINNFHGVFGIYEIPYIVGVLITLFVFVVIVNSLNLIDGIDGLAALLCIKFFVIIGAILAISSKEMELVVPSIIGALIGFLIYNMNPHKKVFLGDTGSLLLGSVMAFYIFYILDDRSYIVTDPKISRPLLAVLLVMYPLLDTLRAFIIRAYKKQSPFMADRVHLHHRLIDKKGFNHWEATLIILLASISVLVLGFLLSIYFSLSLVVLCLLIYIVGVFFLIFK